MSTDKKDFSGRRDRSVPRKKSKEKESGRHDPQCPNCNKPIIMGKLLKCAEVFDRATISAVARCPLCAKAIVFQVRNNRMAIGYTHSAGASKFEAVFEVEAKGLKCIRDKDGVHYTFQGKDYAVPFRKGDKEGR